MKIRQEIIKNKESINEIEMKKTIEKSLKLEASSLRRQAKLIDLQPDSPRKKGREIKLIKLEMKKKKL